MRAGWLALVTLPLASLAHAQDVDREEPDVTRLDVARLPVDAIEVTRDLYAHGIFVEAMIGGRSFFGAAGRFSALGLYGRIGAGYELTRWLWVKLAVEGSIHPTDAPAPPAATVFEVLGVVGEVRAQLDLSSVLALWLGGEIALATATNDVLQSYGLADSGSLGLSYGGTLGMDVHLASAHQSLGVFGGARLYPSFDMPEESSAGIHGGVYLRYVF